MFYDEERASVIMDAFELSVIAHKSGSIDTRFPSGRDASQQLELSRGTYKKLYGNLLPYCTHNISLSITRKYGDL